jgi:hypothetical protein
MSSNHFSFEIAVLLSTTFAEHPVNRIAGLLPGVQARGRQERTAIIHPLRDPALNRGPMQV